LEVKTKTVNFYVQRNNSFGEGDAIIPFELALLNEGGAMVLESGIFTAPVPGLYHFEFSGQKSISATYLAIFLQLNGENVGIAHTRPGVPGSYDSIFLSASLRLKAGDRVNLFNLGNGGVLHDDINHPTHFTGLLVEEDLTFN